MWFPASIHTLPTSSDLKYANEALNEAEEQLGSALSYLRRVQTRLMHLERDPRDLWSISVMIQQRKVLDDGSFTTSMTKDEAKQRKDLAFPLVLAHLRVNGLRNYLLELRRWISPIRMLNVDVLTLIFEFAISETDWRTTLRIAAVSRFWRHVVLSTSHFWTYIGMKDCPHEDAIKTFIERSGQIPLHISLPTGVSFDCISHHAERIKCLSIGDSHSDVMSSSFSRLKWLSIRDDSLSFPINPDLLPALSHLVYDTSPFHDTLVNAQMPPLETLALQARGTWYEVITSCRESLVSLKIDRYTGHRFSKIRLPRLKCLEIVCEKGRFGSLDLVFVTPVLETYIEVLGSHNLRGEDFGTMETVKYLRVDAIHSVSRFPNVRVVQFTGSLDANDFTERLLIDDTLYPHLERIELEPKSVRMSPTCLLGMHRVGSRVVEVGVVSGMCDTPLPGMISTVMASL